MTDKQWDKKLKIHTEGREEFFADRHHHPYEPTSYRVLERLCQSGYLQKNDRLLDYGCGKGRVGFFCHHAVGCYALGLDYQPELFRQAEENRRRYGKDGVEFLCADARDYFPKGINRFYFFNPFSAELLRPVLEQIFSSYFEKPRKMLLFFYYPSSSYRELLFAESRLRFVEELDCRDLFDSNDKRETILIFSVMD